MIWIINQKGYWVDCSQIADNINPIYMLAKLA